ncbi:MAG: hypothetical protein MRZ79_15330 [Bacteroidia bacterium]|nr:hypothetical protein [Bacteroidia bacterium]
METRSRVNSHRFIKRSRYLYQIGLIVGLFGFLFGLANNPQPEPSGFATLRVYQKGTYFRNGFGLHVNGKRVVKRLRPRTWFDIQVPVGELTLETLPEFKYPSMEAKTFYFEAKEGELYYIEALMDYEFMVNRMYLIQRDSVRAAKDLKRLKEDTNARKKLE